MIGLVCHIKRCTKCEVITSPVMSQSFKTLEVMINFLVAKNHHENILIRTILVQLDECMQASSAHQLFLFQH